MNKSYRIFSQPNGYYNGCMPITVHWVQVRKKSLFNDKWENIKGFEDYKKAKQLLDILNG